ncbi:MAG: Nif3-like dinuclear metal center hexameric protein [Desulfobacca sp.]|uniref:Nif3-like dinuclear metal center hexameric protein n=1 Tax=Desulfobacca sp. TaxID=2067990 RepID=UPI0040490A02
MSTTVQDILALVEKQAPVVLAASWDRVGLQLGSPQQPVQRLMVALEPTCTVIQEAVAAGAELLLTHHPLLFQPVQQLNPDNPQHRPITLAISHNLAVAAAHTNLDAAAAGLNAYLAQLLGLTDSQPLALTHTEPLLKLTVFIPVGYEGRVREAVCQAGAGVIGNYSHCTFQVRGQGTYLPLTGAHPWQGAPAVLNRAAEVRLEVILPQGLVSTVLANLRAVHPYEEVAYDLYPLANAGIPYGSGRIGSWPAPRPFSDVVAELKRLFHLERLKITGRPRPRVQRLAICGGSGGDLIPQAWQQGADLYLTGDVRYHQAVPFAQEEMAIIDLGHYATEVLFIPEWGRRLQAELQAANLSVAVLVAAGDADPFSYL